MDSMPCKPNPSIISFKPSTQFSKISSSSSRKYVEAPAYKLTLRLKRKMMKFGYDTFNDRMILYLSQGFDITKDFETIDHSHGDWKRYQKFFGVRYYPKYIVSALLLQRWSWETQKWKRKREENEEKTVTVRVIKSKMRNGKFHTKK